MPHWNDISHWSLREEVCWIDVIKTLQANHQAGLGREAMKHIANLGNYVQLGVVGMEAPSGQWWNREVKSWASISSTQTHYVFIVKDDWKKTESVIHEYANHCLSSDHNKSLGDGGIDVSYWKKYEDPSLCESRRDNHGFLPFLLHYFLFPTHLLCLYQCCKREEKDEGFDGNDGSSTFSILVSQVYQQIKVGV